MGWDPLASVGRVLTLLEFWFAALTALTYILHVPLQVYRKRASMFTTYRLPAEVQMFSDMNYIRFTRIAVERANDTTYSTSRTSASSRRRISGRALELINGHESFLALSNRGALSILDASFSFARVESCVFSAVIGVLLA